MFFHMSLVSAMEGVTEYHGHKALRFFPNMGSVPFFKFDR